MGYIGFQDSNGKWIKPTEKEKKEFLDSLPELDKKNTQFLDETSILNKKP